MMVLLSCSMFGGNKCVCLHGVYRGSITTVFGDAETSCKFGQYDETEEYLHYQATVGIQSSLFHHIYNKNAMIGNNQLARVLDSLLDWITTNPGATFELVFLLFDVSMHCGDFCTQGTCQT